MVNSAIHQPQAKQQLSSFDGTSAIETSVYRPDRYRDVKQLVSALPAMSFKGAGLSYTLASTGAGIPTIDFKCFNRFLHFDLSRRTLKVESGAQLGEILQWAVGQGFNVGVLPGHPTITVGGCVAFNVHGKSQFSNGNFENIVEALTLFHPTHGELVCSREQNTDLFWLTLGGMGLTGLILDVTLILAPLKGAQIERTAIPCDDVIDAFTKMNDLEAKYDYLYSWNNFCRTGEAFGRGVVYAEKFVGDPKTPRYGEIKSKLKPVKGRPSIALFRGETAGLINRIYEFKERMTASTTRLDIGPASFPIAGKEFYFSLLGRPGFIEYQCIFPMASVREALKSMQPLFREYGIQPSLGSTKFFRGKLRHLCFQMDGFCVAIDIPVAGNPKMREFLAAMDLLITQHGGIVNIAKDSRLSRESAEKMYPAYQDFWDALKKWDPSRHFIHTVRSRLEPLL